MNIEFDETVKSYDYETYRCVELVIYEDTVQISPRYHSDNGEYATVHSGQALSVNLPTGLGIESYRGFAMECEPVMELMKKHSKYDWSEHKRYWYYPPAQDDCYDLLRGIQYRANEMYSFFVED